MSENKYNTKNITKEQVEELIFLKDKHAMNEGMFQEAILSSKMTEEENTLLCRFIRLDICYMIDDELGMMTVDYEDDDECEKNLEILNKKYELELRIGSWCFKLFEDDEEALFKIDEMTNSNQKFINVFNKALNLVVNDSKKYKEVFLYMDCLKVSKKANKVVEILNDKIKQKKLTLNSFNKVMKENIINMNPEIIDGSLVSYMGYKLQHKSKMVDSFNYVINDEIDSVCDTFLGMGGSIMSLHESMTDNNIKNLILGDKNPSILYLNKNVAENTEALIEALIEIYRIIHYRDGSVFRVRQDTLDFLKNTLYVLEKSGQYENVNTSALFMFIQNLQFRGRYDARIHDNGNTVSNMSTSFFNSDLYFRGMINFVHKINKYSKMYNSYNTIFLNEGYETLVDNHRDREEVLFLFDPPYYDTKVQYIKTDKRGCEFNQENLLNKLQNVNFIYTNYKVRDIYDYAKRFNFRIDEKVRRNKISVTDEAKTEYFMTSNKTNYEKKEEENIDDLSFLEYI